MENDPHNASDYYGRTKSLGEPAGAMNIRTSIIGEEAGQARSLMSWILSQKGNEVKGFTNHLWNGLNY